MEYTRINKYLSEMGICSRREADRLLYEGRICVNGAAASAGQKVSCEDDISIDGVSVTENAKKPEAVLIAFNKPRGVVCTSSDRDRAVNIIDYIDYKTRLFPIGRLDKESEGLILLTNRGELVNLINKAAGGHEKEYVVRCMNRISPDFIKKMSEGVSIRLPADTDNKASESLDGRQQHTQGGGAFYGKNKSRGAKRHGKDSFIMTKTLPCTVRQIDEHSFDIILKQGLNRQIRRMCEALGNKVTELKRIRIMNIELGKLKEGEYREINGKELGELEKKLGL